MGGVKRYAIQREDEMWYAGTSQDGTLRWSSDFEEAYRFATFAELTEVLPKLQRAGEQIRVYGVP